jgi:hypothetical protein
MELVIERISVVLGFFTLAAAITTFLSCKSCLSFLRRFGVKTPLNNKTYQKFYQYHSYYWWSFSSLLVVHLSLAIGHTGIPQAGDPDAPVHWYILSFGFAGALLTSLMFSSCRICSSYFTRVLKQKNKIQLSYQQFSQYHSYFWGVFLLLFVAHFYFAHSHVGFWPMPEM